MKIPTFNGVRWDNDHLQMELMELSDIKLSLNDSKQ